MRVVRAIPRSNAGVAPEADTAELRRSARRLRWQFRNDAGKLHRSLRELHSSRPAQERGAMRSVAPRFSLEALPLASDRLVAERFAESVEDVLRGGVLWYGERRKLLRRARREGIEPFEASLIIALVEHRASRSGPAAAEAAPTSAFSVRTALPRRGWVAPALAAAAAQLLLLAAAWRILF